MRKISVIVPVLLLVLAACGQAAPSGGQSSLTPTTEPAGTPAAAPPTEAAPPTNAPEPTTEASAGPTAGLGASVRPPDALVETAQQRLAQHLGIAAGQLSLQSANHQEWPDSALGCPQDGQVYLQVVTPGYELVFSDASQAQTYAVHTGEDGHQMLLCENNKPTNLDEAAAGTAPQPSASPAPGGAVAPDAASRALVDQARQMLVQELGVDASAVTLQRVEATEWRDSSLGCPQPGMNYLQVITPGYLIVLEAEGSVYEFHTDTRSRIVRCDRAEGAAGAGPADQSPLAGTAWKLEALGDASAPTPALGEANITLMFDGAQNAMGGNSGCNSYGGTYKVDGAELSFSQIAGTLKACASQPLMDQETQYLQALQTVSGYTIDGDQLELTYDGTKVLRFRAAVATS